MKIQPLPLGHAVLKRAFLHPRPGIRRRLDLLLPGPWLEPMPIRGWLISHGEERILVDMGDTVDVKDAPFAKHTVTRQDELPAALDAAGCAAEAITTAVVTHLHPDHFHGAVYLPGPVLVDEAEYAEAVSWRGRIFQRMSGVPVPGPIDFRPVALDGGPFGAFAASRALTADGRVQLVATPGHTTAHASVIAIDDEGRHVMLAGDTTDTLEQLHARRADAITASPRTQIETIDRILAHTAEHPTVYLPTHDPDSVTRLEAGTTI